MSIDFFERLYVYQLVQFGFALCHNTNRRCIDCCVFFLPFDKWECKVG